MNRKLVFATLLIILLLAIAGAASAATAPGRSIAINPDTSINVTCLGGILVAEVDNSRQPAVARVTCFSFLPP